MASYIGTFRRKEIKYRLSASQLEGIEEAIAGRMALDGYGRTRIASLYFDDSHDSLICRSLEKPVYKEKLRLRAYGVPAHGDAVFLELKKKFKGIVYKRRVGLSYEAAMDYLHGVPYVEACERHPLADERQQAKALSRQGIQVSREIDAFIDRYAPLHPAMLIECQREAFYEVDPGADIIDRELRITFDRDIAYTPYHEAAGDGDGRILGASQSSQPGQLLGEGEALMEIKSVGAYPLWLAEALSELEIKPASFSKYGEAFKRVAAAAHHGKHEKESITLRYGVPARAGRERKVAAFAATR